MASQNEDTRPAAVRELFSQDGDLTLKTELSPRMIQTLLRMKILQEAANPRRTVSLMQIASDEYKKLMVSYKRKGRLELLAATQALAGAESEEIDRL